MKNLVDKLIGFQKKVPLLEIAGLVLVALTLWGDMNLSMVAVLLGVIGFFIAVYHKKVLFIFLDLFLMFHPLILYFILVVGASYLRQY